MSTPNDDPNTKGKGASTDDVDANAGQPDGSDTSADNEEGKDEAATTVETPEPDTKVVPEPEEDDEPLPGDDGEKKFTQTEVNKIVSERLKKKTTKLNDQFTARETELSSTVKSLTAELETYRNAEKDSVKAEFEKLPEEVRLIAPATLDTAEGVAAIKTWLPKVKTLAEKIAGTSTEDKTDSKKVPSGNAGDPKPKGSPIDTSDEAIIAKAKTHSIYGSF